MRNSLTLYRLRRDVAAAGTIMIGVSAISSRSGELELSVTVIERDE